MGIIATVLLLAIRIDKTLSIPFKFYRIILSLNIWSCDLVYWLNSMQTGHNTLLNSTCNLSPLLSALTSSSCSLRAILLIKSHPLLVFTLALSPDFAPNTSPTFLGPLVAALPSFPPLISIMPNDFSALEGSILLFRSLELLRTSLTNLSPLKQLVAISKGMG